MKCRHVAISSLCHGVAFGLALSIAACAGSITAATSSAVTATVSQAQGHLQEAIQLYGVSKGIAEVAAVADPGLAPGLAAVTASLDPLVAQAQAALTAATVDAAAIDALAANITAQANELTLAAAPVIKAVPSAAS